MGIFFSFIFPYPPPAPPLPGFLGGPPPPLLPAGAKMKDSRLHMEMICTANHDEAIARANQKTQIYPMSSLATDIMTSCVCHI